MWVYIWRNPKDYVNQQFLFGKRNCIPVNLMEVNKSEVCFSKGSVSPSGDAPIFQDDNAPIHIEKPIPEGFN